LQQELGRLWKIPNTGGDLPGRSPQLLWVFQKEVLVPLACQKAACERFLHQFIGQLNFLSVGIA
jgi:hypothetical protein